MILAAGLLCFAVTATAQNRFSGAVEPGAKVYLGEKNGVSFGTDVVIGALRNQRNFWGLGLGYHRVFLENEEYSPVTYDHRLDGWDFTNPKTLKYAEYPLFLNYRFYPEAGLSGFTIDCRAGIAFVFSPQGLGGTFWSVGVGKRFNLTGDTGLAFRIFYEMKDSAHADDVYSSTLGRFHALGLRVAYEF